MAKNQVYLIKSGQNSFIEETEAIIGISGGRIGVGTTAPESDFHITGNTQIDGDLTVRGNFSTINETSVQVDDKNIELGVVDVPTDITADGGGITLRGATNKTISWLGSNAAWNFNQDVRVDSGKLFKGEKVEAINSLGLELLNESGSGVFLKSSNIGINLDLDVSGSGNFSQGLYVNGEAVVTGSAGKWYDGNVVGQIFYTGGNVGVNSDSPVYDLDVSGSGNFSQGLYVNGEAVVTGSAGKWYDGNVVGQIFYTGGNVGVNSDSPVYDLDVSGSGNFSQGLYVNGEAVVTGSAGKWYDGNVVGQIFYTGGNVGVNSDSPVYDLDVSGSGNFSQGLYVDGNAVLTGIASSSLGKWQDGNEAGEIFYDAGKVGVGTDNPEYDLHVDGNTYIEGSLNVSSEFKVGSNGAVGDTQPVQDGDIVKWDLANSKWSVGSNIPGGLVTGEVPLGFIKPLASGSSIYQVDFVEEYDAIPSISTDLQIEGDGDIIPYVISGVSASSYNLVFAKNLPNNNYRIHTTFGGRPVYWKTGSDASVNYTEGDVNILRDLTVSGNLTVDGTQLIVNTETIKLEDHNIEIAANAGYDTISDAGISWGTGIAGASSPVSLSYSNGQGFNFAGGNVGIGTTSPEFNLSIVDSTDAIIQLKGSDLGRVYFGDTADNNIGRIQYYHVNNSMQFWTNGAEQMRIDSNGNVGIGTTSPSRKLQIHSDTAASQTVAVTTLLGANAISHASIGHGANKIGNLQLGNASGNLKVFLSSEGDSYLIGGNVGIGTTSPSASLHVAGVGRFDVPTGGALISSWTTGVSTGENQPVLVLRTNETSNNDRVKLHSDGNSYFNGGNVGIGTTSPSAQLELYAPTGVVGLRIKSVNTETSYVDFADPDDNNPGSIAYNHPTNAMTFKTNDSEKMRISSGGNVGIGTTNPFSKLDVNGIIEAGSNAATSGTVGLRIKYSGASDDYINNFGSMYSSGASLIGYAVRSSEEEHDKFLSTADNANFSRGALVVGVDLEYLSAGPQITPVGDEVSLTSRFKILSNGHVGIGTTDPGYPLEVKLSTDNWASRIYNTRSDVGAAGLLVRTDATAVHDAHAFGVYADGGYKFSVKSDGNVGIGTPSPLANLHILGDNSLSGSQGFIRIDNDVHGTAGLIGDATALMTGGVSNQLAIRGSAAGIVFGVGSSPKMFLNGQGSLGVGTNSYASYSLTTGPGSMAYKSDSDGAGSLLLSNDAAKGWSCMYLNKVNWSTNSPDSRQVAFYVNGVQVGTISSNATTTSYNETSDRRLKKNIEDCDSAISKVGAIRVRRFDWKIDDSRQDYGVIAQELISVAPRAVYQSVNEEDMMGVDLSKLVPMLIKCSQEQQQLIESQQSTINDLMSRVESLES